MPEAEAPKDLPEPTSSRASIVESLPSDTESLTLSDNDFEISIVNSVESSSESETALVAAVAASIDTHLPDLDLERIRLPLENDLRTLLIKVTAPQSLGEVTSVRLRVIARDFSLQLLPTYLPRLRELILDGSCLTTLRDLGCGLRALNVLRIARTGLRSLDGLTAFPGLLELYASHNQIKNFCVCAMLPNLERLDLSYNIITEVGEVSFLSLCNSVRHVKLEGNPTSKIGNYRSIVKNYLPSLESLDDIDYDQIEADRSIEPPAEDNSVKIISKFPPIPQRNIQEEGTLKKVSRRPLTTGSLTNSSTDYVKMLPVRPATARKASASDFSCIVNGSHLKLKDIRNLFVPSRLTSGKPMCGNPALALWEKRTKQAWDDDGH